MGPRKKQQFIGDQNDREKMKLHFPLFHVEILGDYAQAFLDVPVTFLVEGFGTRPLALQGLFGDSIWELFFGGVFQLPTH